MSGRPKMMAKRVEALWLQACDLDHDLTKVARKQYRDAGPLYPEFLEELNETVSPDEDIALHWRACIGHAVRLDSLLEDLTSLLCEKAGIPDPFWPEEDLTEANDRTDVLVTSEQPAEQAADGNGTMDVQAELNDPVNRLRTPGTD